MSELTHAEKVESAKRAMRNGEQTGADEMLVYCDHDNLLESVAKLRKCLIDAQQIINTTGDIQFNRNYSAKEKERRMEKLFMVHADDILTANSKALEETGK